MPIKKLYLELTDKCNLDCKICYRKSWGRDFYDMKQDVLNKLTNELKTHSDLREIVIGGIGEPTFSKHFKKTLELLKDYRITVRMYLHHVENPFASIKEMTRILKSGGKLVLTDLDEHNFEFLKTEQFDRWMGFKREDVKQWFIDAGLKNVNIDCAGGNCCSTSNSGCENASISIFVAYGEK